MICESALMMKVKAQEIDYGGVEVGAMVAMIIGYRLITYVLLRRMKLRTEA